MPSRTQQRLTWGASLALSVLGPGVGRAQELPLQPGTPANGVEAFLPCAEPPAGMVCIPGGPAVVGSDDGPANERPRRSVTLSTFYIDQHEVTNGDYDACEAAHACDVRAGKEKTLYQPFMLPEQPAVGIDWFHAQQYCVWAGKRLPSEWEWEKAARGETGTLYPWGNEAPTCERAQYRECAPRGCKPSPGFANPWDCPEHTTRPAGSYPAGNYGLSDMAGNGYEWTGSWATATIERCGDDCRGSDPRGPCAGASPCPGRAAKILRGGSWYWPVDQVRRSYRRSSPLETGGHRLSVRCATSHPFLTRFPPRKVTVPRPQLAPLTPPTAEELALFRGITEDPIEKRRPCEHIGRARLGCRDPIHYVFSNEYDQHLWRPYIENLGGGYVGVGADSNYSLLAATRSRWAWLVDYDIVVVTLHRLNRVFILAADTPAGFVELWQLKSKRRALELLAAAYPEPEALGEAREVFNAVRGQLAGYYRNRLKEPTADDRFHWLRNPEAYAYVRSMFEQGRINPVRGDLLGNRAMASIGATARKLGVSVRVYYPSNAPEMWPLSPTYRDNVRGLPFDAESVILQTFSTKGLGSNQKGAWQYNVQDGLDQQALLGRQSLTSAVQLISDRIKTAEPRLTLVGLRSD